ncbi:MAG: hypothetical protein WDM80_12380 [Limisphaerales bacterium]
MKLFNHQTLGGLAVAAAFFIIPLSSRADGTNTVPPPPKPDLLKTCPVSDEKLGEMGKPVVFVYEAQEVKLCCKGCKKDFDKDPAKYIKKIRAADKK